MVTSRIVGGLGNNMFQIAAALSLSVDNDDICIFDSVSSISVHKHMDSYKTNILRNLRYGKPTVSGDYGEPFFHYRQIPYTPNIKLNGYYQSEKYFKHNREKILECFSIDDVSCKYIEEKYGEVLSGDTCSVHIRRGDYLGVSNIHPPCSLSYYNEAIKQIDNNTTLLIFSDDIKWCKENLNFDNPTHFIYGNVDYIDMWLMSLCDNNITANSSFSWWGSWLNQNPNKKVISPKKWFGPGVRHNTQDLIPETWITI